KRRRAEGFLSIQHVGPSVRAERRQIEVDQGLLLYALVLVLTADRDDFADDLRLEAIRLGLSVNLLDVFGNGFALFAEAFDALDECAQMSGVDFLCAGFLRGPRRLSHVDSRNKKGRE